MKRKGGKTYGKVVATLNVLMEIPDPPPPEDYSSPFMSIKEWLYHLADTNQCEKHISVFGFGFLESPSRLMLCLEGSNTYKIDENTVEHRRDFKPVSYKYFVLPKEEFANLPKEQVAQRVKDELLEFFKTAKFHDSFLSKGDAISLSYMGNIWTK